MNPQPIIATVLVVLSVVAIPVTAVENPTDIRTTDDSARIKEPFPCGGDGERNEDGNGDGDEDFYLSATLWCDIM